MACRRAAGVGGTVFERQARRPPGYRRLSSRASPGCRLMRRRPPAPRWPHGPARAARPGGVIQAIRVEGNQRIESGTVALLHAAAARRPVRSRPHRPQPQDALRDRAVPRRQHQPRRATTLVVQVVENPIVNRIAFEGNHAVTDAQLLPVLGLRPRAVFTPQMAEADRQHILDLYAQRGRYAATVVPKVIRLPQNRVDVVFEINEGTLTLVSRITFVGNHAFGEGELKDVISSREQAFWRILSNSDEYNPERVNFDREQLRRFYLKNGFVDFRVENVSVELAPDRSSFFLTFVLHEGARYRVGKVSVDSHLPKVPGASLMRLVQLSPGDWYDGDAVERTTQAIEDDLQRRGFAFIEVTPRIARNTCQAHRQSGVRRGAGPARLCRAHQHHRQHPHRGQGHPPRVPARGGRRLQRLGDPQDPPAAAGSRLFQQRGHQDRARLGAGPRDPRHHGRGKIDRRVYPRRRLLDRYRRPRQRRPARAQPDRHRHRREPQRHAGAEGEPGEPLRHRPLFPRPQPGRGLRPLPRADQQPRHLQLQRAPHRRHAAARLPVQRPSEPGMELLAGAAHGL